MIKKRGGKCKICRNLYIVCERGYQNFISHLNSAHGGKDGNNDYKIIFNEQKKDSGTNMTLDSFVDVKSSIYFKWLDWIINKNLPFNFCEDQYTKKHCNIPSISRNTFMKIMIEVNNVAVNRMCNNVKEE